MICLVPAAEYPHEPRDYLRREIERRAAVERRRIVGGITTAADISSVARQLAELTHTVEGLAADLKTLIERADSQQTLATAQQERADIQQDRIDVAARELVEVSDRLQAAANALRESV